ncbi:MAG: hypothetical protein PHE49_04395 [bacterium]|nr:hypothetical protein [bacterium]
MAIIKRDKIIIEGEENIGLSSSRSSLSVDAPNNTELKEPGISINKANGIVNSIDILCTCGRKIHIDCEYEEKPKA